MSPAGRGPGTDDDAIGSWIARGVGVMAAALALAACDGGAGTVCSTIGWGSTLTVDFAEDWPPVEGGVTIRCSPECMRVEPADGAPGSAAIDPATGSTVTVSYSMSTPDSVILTVVAPDGVELTEVDADLDWQRVGGSEECGGPHAATVVVPAP